MGTCFLCLDECDDKTTCDCNSFLHDKCKMELHEKWSDKKNCPYCKQKYTISIIVDTDVAPRKLDITNISHQKFFRCDDERLGKCDNKNCNFLHMFKGNHKYYYGNYH